MTEHVDVKSGDALLIVDVQNDFLPGGSLAVTEGDQVTPVLNGYIEVFSSAGLSVFATRDWHPVDHCSFKAQGGIWPPHCIADTVGAAFDPDLDLNDEMNIVSKATTSEKDAYSGFEDTDLVQQLRDRGVNRLFIGGLATDYCVLNTVKDALALNFSVYVLKDAIRAVNVEPNDGLKAEAEMQALGAKSIELDAVRK